MLFDTHLHCEFSCDSHMQLQQAMETAARQGIGIVVTEHWDYDYPTNPDKFLFDRDAYFKNFEPWRSATVLRGIEVGMQKHTAAADEKVGSDYSFDYVLGAIHCMGRKDIYEPVCYEGRTRAEAVEEFLDDTIYCLESHHNFDALAHIDYMCRYWPYQGAEQQLYLEDNPAKFDRIFKLLIEGNKAFEINTRRLDDQEAIKSLLLIYKRFKALGGRYCTLGSDAHYCEHVGRRLQVALAIAKEAELQPVYFRERQMQLIKI